MDFPLANLFIIHWIRPYSTLCLTYKSKAFKNVNNHFLFSIMNTIHYNALLTDEYSVYKELIDITLQTDHSIDKFKSLKEKWDASLCDPIVIDYYSKANAWVVRDGVHRLCLLKYFGMITDRIPFSRLKFNVPNSDKLKIQRALRNTTNTVLYNGWNNKRTEYGYHSYEFFDLGIRGQRNNMMRIEELKKHIDFMDKSVLDLGCNTGGLLHHLPEIKKGRGFDYDATCVAAGNLVNSVLRLHKDLTFSQADLEKVEFDTLACDGPFDIMFLCSLGSWIKNWCELYTWAVGAAPLIIFEENNATEGRAQIELFTSLGCSLVRIIENSPDDYSGNRMRNTYLIRRP